MFRFCSRTPPEPLQPLALSPTGNSGKRARICAGVVVEPLELLCRPEKGLATELARYVSPLSRTGSVLRNCRGMPLSCV